MRLKRLDRRCFCLMLLAVLMLPLGRTLSVELQAAGTVTFTADDSGTYAESLHYDSATKQLTVDLSALPKDANVFRAELVLRALGRFQHRPVAATRVFATGEPDKPLKFVPPRFTGLDALEPVRRALAADKPLVLTVENTAAGIERLEISCDNGQPRREDIPDVTELAVTHRAGQSLIVFREPSLEAFPQFKTGADVRAFAKRIDERHPGVRMRIWRSAEPITPKTIHKARLVGECGLLTCWNDSYHQGQTNRQPPLRYRVTDGGDEVVWGTGIYAHNPREAGKAYYAVTVAIDGEEDFDQLDSGNTADRPVDEMVGLGEPILQWKETPQEWMYRLAAKDSHLTRLIYTRWESWPHSPTPSKPIDYLVVIPNDPPPKDPARQSQYRAFRVEPAPVGLHLHCWGGSLNGGYGWWYNAHQGAVLIASNQEPYDWWTGHHEAIGTRKTWGDGHVRPFTVNRLLGFLDWAERQHEEAPQELRGAWPRLDLTRTFTAGNSMGGSGAPMLAIRHSDRIAWGLGWVGVHVPEESPQFKGSYERMYGPRDPAITLPDGKTSPWDYFSDAWWLKEHPERATGMVIASNGKNDGGIGWPQAVKFAKALQQTRRPHIFNWALGGHGTRTIIGANFDLDVRTDQSLPAFTNCTLDGDIGTGRRKSDEAIAAQRRRQQQEVDAGQRREVQVDPFDGNAQGAFNAHLRWETETIVDTPEGWEITVILLPSAPQDSCRVDLTPRRLQQFKTTQGRKFNFTVVDRRTGKRRHQGQAVADEHDLLTLPQIPLAKGHSRVTISPAQ